MIRAMFAVVFLDGKRFLVEAGRLLFGAVQPLLYVFVLGAGLGGSSRMASQDYQHYIFPGTMGLAIYFSSVHAAITIVFDRQVGFFKAILVAPVSRTAIAGGKVISGALQGLLQGLVILPFAPLAGIPLDFQSVMMMILAMLFASFAFSAIGLAAASRFKTILVYPVVTNVILLPGYFLSGGMYPLSLAPHWMQSLAQYNPIAYGIDLIRYSMQGVHFFPLEQTCAVLLATVVLTTAITVFILNQGEDDSILGDRSAALRRS